MLRGEGRAAAPPARLVVVEVAEGLGDVETQPVESRVFERFAAFEASRRCRIVRDDRTRLWIDSLRSG